MRKDSKMRKLLVFGVAVLASLAIGAAPAAARKHDQPPKHTADEFSYVATLNCGQGPMVVGSGDNTADPFVELQTGQRYFPLMWHVKWDGGGFHEVLPNPQRGGRRMLCSYDDGFATGVVIVVKERGPRGRD
jgi:hypothetical protein